MKVMLFLVFFLDYVPNILRTIHETFNDGILDIEQTYIKFGESLAAQGF